MACGWSFHQIVFPPFWVIMKLNERKLYKIIQMYFLLSLPSICWDRMLTVGWWSKCHPVQLGYGSSSVVYHSTPSFSWLGCVKIHLGPNYRSSEKYKINAVSLDYKKCSLARRDLRSNGLVSLDMLSAKKIVEKIIFVWKRHESPSLMMYLKF